MWVIANKTKLEYVIFNGEFDSREDVWELFNSMSLSRDWVTDKLYASLNNLPLDQLLIKEVEDDSELKQKKYKNVTSYLKKDDLIDLDEGKFSSSLYTKEQLNDMTRKEVLNILKEVREECLLDMCIRDKTNLRTFSKSDLLEGLARCAGHKKDEDLDLYINQNQHKSKKDLYNHLLKIKIEQRIKHVCTPLSISSLKKEEIIKHILKCQKK